ncbi:2,3,4,5-tetrahydropyridine-2,6-dicarboxylate N-succinyltransferase [Bryobacter aggregatus]|uniref:2,3,4,5-tetrahydropyridine-2,6-dicarboxylate N-succinyltransferase n=1 Tax=Bryobacter aggregatus TaxID=360054 RepID=UPI0004E1674E|nr:2,3,4,5-tetrahydropyridine-2,6-dicarboxylate N-succinyltransferase [Bryobacter aggregatus]
MQEAIEAAFALPVSELREEHQSLFRKFKEGLNDGRYRAAQPDANSATGWSVNAWVKKGILLGFRLGQMVDMSIDLQRQPYFDKATYPVKQFSIESGVRLVPGGSSVRDGAFVGAGVICMPPMFINAGAYVDAGTMVDSHALVGSCAQVGKNCHLSAAAQIGGVLEPVGASPVIIEDEVMVGGNCGVYEGTVVKKRAVLGTGVILNRSTPVYDLVKERVLVATEEQPLVIPEEAVVVAGARQIARGIGKEWGVSLYTPVIVKYRDQKTEGKLQLEDLLR